MEEDIVQSQTQTDSNNNDTQAYSNVKQPKTDKALQELFKLVANKNYGKSIGFTKQTLEKRVEKRREKEKNRRKLNLARRKAAR